MAKSSRGRRAVADQLGLIDRSAELHAPGNRVKGSKHVADNQGRKPVGTIRSPLPSDSRIAETIFMRIIRWFFKIIAFFLLASVALVLVYRIIDPPITPLMLIRPIEGLAEMKLVGINKNWVSLDDINPVLIRSVIASEDGRFFSHEGVDWKAVEEAQRRNERSDGKKLYGASTITMQCARNVFLWQGRNYVRKGLEIYFTYLMEFLWSKERIMEVYLNVIEWGDGVYGVEAASQKYFGVPASKLNARQASLLAAVLPNPRIWSPAKPTGYISSRASTIAARARGVGLAPLKEERGDKKESTTRTKKK